MAIKQKNTNVSIAELGAMGAVSGIVDMEKLRKYASGELSQFVSELPPEKEEEILARVFRLKEIRSKLLSLREGQAEKGQTKEQIERRGKKIVKLEGQLDEFLAKLSQDATPENKEIYTKYLKMMIATDEVYRQQVEPLRHKQREALGESNLVTSQIARAHRDSKKKGLITGLEDDRDDLDQEYNEITKQIDSFVGPEGTKELYNVERLNYLRNVREQLDHGKFVELNGENSEIDFVRHALRLNEPVMLVGDLGSGKTEALRHAAKQHLLEKGRITEENFESTPILVFSGSKEASIYDLMGKMKIKHKDQTLPERIEKLKTEAKEIGLNLTDKMDDQILDLAVRAYDAGWSYSEFANGVMAQAIKNNVPIIIDEIDQMPPEILARINELLTLRPGAPFRIQENGEETVTIPEDFIIMATANLKSGKYKSREELDAAFASRFLIREHDYLSEEDSYDLLLGYFINSETGTLRSGIPKEASAKFPHLIVAMKEIQEIFQGKFKTASLLEGAGAGAVRHMELEKTTFSTRSLIKVLDYWTKTGMNKMSLDDALGTVLLSPINKRDQLYILDILLRFGFFKGWTSQDFSEKFTIDVEDEQIKNLHGMLTTEAGVKEQGKFTDLLSKAEKSMMATTRMMGYFPGQE